MRTIRNVLESSQDLGADPDNAVIIIADKFGSVAGSYLDDVIMKYLELPMQSITITMTDSLYVIAAVMEE